MNTVTMNPNQQKKFSTEQLDYLHLSLEQAQQVPYIQTIEVTPKMIKEQEEKIRKAEKSVKRPSWKLWKKYGGIHYCFVSKRFMYSGSKKEQKERSPEGHWRDKEGYWLELAIEWAIDNFPDEYEKECLKCLKLGLKPYPGLILRRVHF